LRRPNCYLRPLVSGVKVREQKVTNISYFCDYQTIISGLSPSNFLSRLPLPDLPCPLARSPLPRFPLGSSRSPSTSTRPQSPRRACHSTCCTRSVDRDS